MSQNSPVPTRRSSAGNASPEKSTSSSSRGLPEKEQPSAGDPSSAPIEPRDSSHGTSAPAQATPWTPSAPVEPPVGRPQVRSLGVHSILNPSPATMPLTTDSPVNPGGQPASRPGPQRSLSATTLSHPSSLSQSAHIVPPHPPSQHRPSPQQPAVSSPLAHSRRILTPVSPTSRLQTAAAAVSGRNPTYPATSPLAPQSSVTQEPPAGPYAPASAGTLANAPGGHLQGRVSLHSTPTFHNRQISGPPTNPSSQENSPSTPYSAFPPFGHMPPAVGGVSVPQPTLPFPSPSPYASVDPTASRLPGTPGGMRRVEEPSVRLGTQQPGITFQGMIPCYVDLKSGSSSQAEKRRANSDASRRFRNRKKQEQQMEQKIAAQQDEIKRQSEALAQKEEEIKALLKERDFYRSERDFYRESFSRSVPLSQLPNRPPSPGNLRLPSLSGSEGPGNPVASGQPARPEIPSTTTAASIPSIAPSPAYISEPASNAQQGSTTATSLPQYPRTWARSER
ncbi:hypothetical protein MPDQ_004938 [Monascus purpureus]|uniref:BZIP domain-containing protein n=1 Tax=Monascus purpureus TaxID=5098 RepID=A0A507QGS7_MONPU|nr:hypothetical protein MPDQ_004938 [Monascus purpureus]